MLRQLGRPHTGALSARAIASQHSVRPLASPLQHHSSSSRRANSISTAAVKLNAMGSTSTGSLRSEVTELFRAALAAAYPSIPTEPVVAATNDPKFGDYQCNNAMALFGRLKGTEGAPKAPRDVGTAIMKALPASELVAETSLAGPGFINLRVAPSYLSKRVGQLLTDGMSTLAPRLPYKRVVVDFSSPNVAKEMHVGHLRSTIIGDTIARTLEFCGVDVVRLNHIGDWGTQFGMLIMYMSEMREGGLNATQDEDVADLQVLYKAAKARFDEDPAFKKRSQEAVTRLQGGDPDCVKAWKRICEASRREFQAIYDRLGVTLTERGESYYNPVLAQVVDELKAAGVAERSEGAMCVFVDGHSVPLIVQKSDGGFGYASTDMAAIKQRLFGEKADWIIYVTDSGQAAHFDMVFGAARKAGWLPPKDSNEGPRVSHVGFGLVLGEDGKKFKTRSGEVVRLVELLDEAKQRCTDTIRTRRAESGDPIGDEELEAASSAMGYGAVKYADLKNSRLTNYKFSYDTMLDLRGNTAVYLQYAHARIASIVRKSGRDVSGLASSSSVVVAHPKEVALALHLLRFSEALEDMLSELMPNRLTDYLYELSEAFNGFYTECKVLGSEEEDSRLLLCEATATVMRACFGLLGITPLYRI